MIEPSGSSPVASVLEVAQHELARGEFVAAEDQRVARAVAVGDLEVREQLAVVVVHEGRRARAVRRSSATIGVEDGARLRSERDRLNAAARRFGLLAAGLEHHQKALEAEREADRRRLGPPSERTRPVVAAAAADGALRAEHARGDLEDRALVVVEAAHDPRIDDVRDAGQIEIRFERVEMLAARRRTERFERRRGRDERQVGRILAVEHAQRIALEPPPRISLSSPRCGRKCASSASR